MSQHPLDRLSRKVHYYGWYQKVLGRMKRYKQSSMPWIVIFLIILASSLYAPVPYRVMDREYIYLEPNDPNSIGLHNSDPDTFRIKTKIDLSLVPDIL